MGLNYCENPWQGSFIIDELTDLVEEAVYTEFDRISERGGVLGAMDTMYQRGKIQDESLYYESRKHDGSYPLIGVNTFLGRHRCAQAMIEGYMQYSRTWRSVALALVTLLPLAQAAGQVRTLEETLAEQRSGVEDAARSQTRVVQLAEETSELLGEYRVTVQQLDRARIYNDNLEELLRDQQREQEDIDRQLASFRQVQQEIVPLMFEMIDDLARFIELDMPFQLQERRDRVERLRELMGRSDVTVSEKYRQIMNAYQIEAEFTRSTEAYDGRLGDRRVDFLRVGRILLAYQTPDRAETGFWNKNTREWELANGYRNDVVEGLRIARKQAAPSLLRLPLPAPEPGLPQ
jgi:hypothetical protein